VVVPDNVLFEEGVGAQIRADLMDKCNLHTILRLPTGIFYAQGVKTNVIFFTRGPAHRDTDNTQHTWVYDLRANMPSFGKRTPLTRAHFAAFEAAYGNDSCGAAPRRDEGLGGRFRCFTRTMIRDRADNLDIAWLRDESATQHDELPEPEEIAAGIMAKLREAMEEMEALSEVLAAPDKTQAIA
jgi:type I restriction enzyme M protein